MKAQGNNLDKKRNGNRYTKEFKMFCLNLYFKGPKAYRILSNTFILPSKRTLERMIQGLIISPGLNDIVFERLRIKIENLRLLDKYCCISIDTMSLKASLFYIINRDMVIGFHDTGYTKSFLPACNAAIIMVRGLTNKFKQPLGYFFLNSTIDADELRIITIECVKRLQSINLKVVAEVTDMGTDYVKAFKKLGVTQETPYYIVNNQKIFYFFDPPHLIKAARNNLLNNIIKSENKIISWQHIKKLYEIDKENINRLVPKIAHDTHIYPNNFQRMKVKYAAQVLSFSVASAINTMISLGHLPTSAKDTSEYVEKLDAAFDIFNSSCIKGKKSSKNAFIASEEQLEFLKSLKTYFCSLKIFTKNGIDITKKVNVFKCWIQNINSLNQMWEYLQEINSGFQFLLTRRINQDIVEHTFGEIRNLSGNSFNPTPVQFYYSFKKSFSTKHCSVQTGNCTLDVEDSEIDMVTKITQFQHETFVQNTSLQKTVPVQIDDHDYRQKKDVIEENAFYYICGYLMSKSLKKHSCDICENFAKDIDNFNYNRYYTLFRAIKSTEDNMYGGLCVPNQIFVTYVENLDNIFFNHLRTFILNESVLVSTITLLNTVVCPHPCKDFPKTYFIKLYARVRLYFELKFANRRFKGKERNKKIIILSHN